MHAGTLSEAYAYLVHARFTRVDADALRPEGMAIQRHGCDSPGHMIGIIDDDVDTLIAHANPRFEA